MALGQAGGVLSAQSVRATSVFKTSVDAVYDAASVLLNLPEQRPTQTLPGGLRLRFSRPLDDGFEELAARWTARAASGGP